MENLVGRKARILNTSIHEMIGNTVTILYSQGREDIIVGFLKKLALVGHTVIFLIICAGLLSFLI